jgi:cell division protein FtsW
VGICIKIAVQVLLNVAVVTNTIPNTGISLPFFSYGGSSLIMIFAEMGIILSASRNSKIHK